MVGRLVQQQQLGLVEQQLAQRDAAALAARKLGDVGIVGRTAQRVHRLVDLAVEIPQALGLDLVLQLGHLVGGLVGIIHRQFVVAIEDRLLLGDALHDVLAHVLGRIELRLLLEIADAGALGDPALAGIFLVDPRHDLQQGRLARAVDAEHADLGVRVERQMDVVEDFPGRVGLGQTLHEIDELARHRDPLGSRWIVGKFAAADIAAQARKGNRGNPFSLRSPRMITGPTPCVRQITTIETSF